MSTSKLPEVFCWSKMGTESGESLEQILIRKEMERLANGGEFAWGVGNSLGLSITMLMQSKKEPKVIFTKMKSKPKILDERPSSIYMWLTYLDQDGQERELPEYTLLTSRGYSGADLKKRTHYALLCSSLNPLEISSNISLNSSRLCNYLTGKPLGYSQVTSVVKRVKDSSEKDIYYNAGFSARLENEGQVKLVSAVKVTKNEIIPVVEAAKSGRLYEWKKEIKFFKEKKRDPSITFDLRPQIDFAY